MTTKEAATLLGVDNQTVLNAISARRVKAKKVKMSGTAFGYIYDVNRASLLKWRRPAVKAATNGTVDHSEPFPLDGAVAFLRSKRDALETAIKALESVK